TFAGAAVGGFHDAGTAAGDDAETAPGQLARKLARGVVHRIRWSNAGGTKDGHGRADGGKCIKTLDELRLDAQDSPGIALEELREGRPFQERAILRRSFDAATNHASGTTSLALFGHRLLTVALAQQSPLAAGD